MKRPAVEADFGENSSHRQIGIGEWGGFALRMFSGPRVFSLLFGEPLDSPLGICASRIIGAALFTLGLACCLARNENRNPAATRLIAALLFCWSLNATCDVIGCVGDGRSWCKRYLALKPDIALILPPLRSITRALEEFGPLDSA
jgi:hypothetical protein